MTIVADCIEIETDMLRAAGERPEEAPIIKDYGPLASACSESSTQSFAPPSDAFVGRYLSMVHLTNEEAAVIAESAFNGADNIQDIYPLMPAQAGMLFSVLMNSDRVDPYVVRVILALSSREMIPRFTTALQSVVDRHDALRTAVFWNRLSEPVQVVHRAAAVPIQETLFECESDSLDWVARCHKSHANRFDLNRPPLLRVHFVVSRDDPHHYALLEIHHIVADAQSVWCMLSEVVAHLDGRAQQLPQPIQFREHVAHTLRLQSVRNSREFFRAKLRSVVSPTAPFGLLDIHGDGANVSEACEALDLSLTSRLRNAALARHVFVAAVIHAACALLVAHTSGRNDVVFGTVLGGRILGSADPERTQGMFLNTLPIRLDLQACSCQNLLIQTHRELFGLLRHQHASLTVAQRCSGIVGQMPLFNTLLNYRYSRLNWETEWARIGLKPQFLSQRTTYPIALIVDDEEARFRLTAQTDRSIDARQMVQQLRAGLTRLVEAIEQNSTIDALSVSRLL